MAGFPNVPNVPGVPALPRAPGQRAIDIALLVADAINFLASFGLPRWGIFQDGLPVIEADTVIGFDYKQNWSISTYPVENGGFANYNKVSIPFDVRVRYAAGGNEGTRQALLQSAEDISDTTELYDVVTPEKVYLNCNVNHVDYRRTAVHGAGMIVLDIWLEEVRENAESAFSNTKTASGASQVNGGTVQPQEFATGNEYAGSIT